MPSLTIKINNVLHHGEITDDGLNFVNTNGAGAQPHNYVGWSNSFGGEIWSFFHFPLPQAVPAGSTITAATLQLRSPVSNFINGWNSVSDYLMIWLQNEAVPLLPDNAGERPDGSGYDVPLHGPVRWPTSGGLAWTANARFTSPDISTLIQHRLDTFGGLGISDVLGLWAAKDTVGDGHALVGWETTASGTPSEDFTPWLNLTWTEPDPPPPPPPIDTDSNILVLRRLIGQ